MTYPSPGSFGTLINPPRPSSQRAARDFLRRQEVWDELDRDARRHFGLTAKFLRIYRDPPGRYHGDVIFRSLTYLARLLDQPAKT